MSHNYTANFRYDNGGAATALSPVIYIWDLTTNTLVVNAGATTEVGGGWYKYVYADTDGHTYVVTFDAGVVAGLTNRYSDGASPGQYDITLTALSVALASLQNDMTSALSLINSVVKVEYGSWDIKSPNILTFYDTDNVTTIAQYLCYDINGNPTTSEVTRVLRTI